MPDKKRKELPDFVKGFLLQVLKDSELEDEYVRNLQTKLWKKLEEYWHSVQFLFWSEIQQDWMTPDNGVQVGVLGEEGRDSVGPFYDYVINIYTAHGESLISTLSQAIKTTEYFPDDADSVDDLTASKAKTQLAVIYQKHIKAKLRFIEALFKLYNQGLVAAYRYREGDKKYGIHKIPKFKTERRENIKTVCPECGTTIPDPINPSEIPTCPDCNMQGETEKTYEDVIVSDGWTEIPKEREVLDINGPLSVKVPYYARTQKDCGYVIWYLEEHYAKARSLFPDWAEEIVPDAGDSKERWSRTPSSYSSAWRGGSEDKNLASIKRVWFRPWMYYSNAVSKELPENNVKDWLDEHFPDGIHFVVIGKNIVDFDEKYYNNQLDRCWSIGKRGPSTYIHSDPIGNAEAPIQEMTNQMANLTIQTVEYGVPTTLADTRIINRDVWSQQENSPGTITSVRKPAEFSRIEDGIFEFKTATLSNELEVVRERLDKDGAFVIGDTPSVSGMDSHGDRETLGEYNSRYQRSLGRLRLIYDYTCDWWDRTVDNGVAAMEHDIKTYGDPVIEVSKSQGNYENIKVEKKDLIGHAHIDYESSNNFPISSDQKLDLLFKLIALNNPMVNQVVGDPENAHIITESLGFSDLYIPYESQRFRALWIIKKLLNIQGQGPIQGPNGEIIPTMQPDPVIDDLDVQIPVFKYYLSSEKGMQVLDTSPEGYANCRGYLDIMQKMHDEIQNNRMVKQVETIQTAKEFRSALNQKAVKTPG